ncbi:hypothetical protein, variant [Batrachochytrium dendrobatidis JEL423]|uniref:2Fe-2S ferredoxin-type domain-containing protein n=1 Tax=Batrachochytrium dendrobatidis (strain JEL423) TaxID=403673 RepID=A0A177WVI7_BATDL|nr:hypothetical protein, variant [Batrachochytrium dendrobatidis JEL423]
MLRGLISSRLRNSFHVTRLIIPASFPTQRAFSSVVFRQLLHISSFGLQQHRCLHASAVDRHGSVERPAPGTGYSVTYITSDNEKITVEAKDGTNLLELAHANGIDLEGACEGSLACSTCHVVVDQEYYDKLSEPSDEENDMLDLAFGLTERYIYLTVTVV